MERDERMDMKGDGFDLFMRFADGCRCYLQSKGVISREDNQAILDYFKTGKKPDSDVLKRVYYVAFPGLEVVGERLGKRMFDADVVRKFYAFDHNKMKVEQGNYVCIAFPAKILEKRDSEYLLELSPVKGNFCIDSDLDLKPGDWVIVHRMNVVEKVSEEYAKNISDNLKRLGVDKEMRFPEKAIKYLKELKRNA